MKKLLKKILLLTLILFCPILVNAKSYDYSLDNTNVLKESTKDYIEKYSSFLNENYNFKYYVVIVKNLGVYNLEELTESYYEQLNINENGILILYVKDNQALRIKSGGKTSYILNDELIEEHINLYFLPFLKNQEIDEGLLNGYKSLYKVICNYYNIDSTEMKVYNANNFYEKYKTHIILFLVWINTATMIFICNIIKKVYCKKQKLNNKNHIILVVSTFINVIGLFLSYLIKPITMFLILAFELFAILNTFSSEKKLDLMEIKEIEYKKELKRQAKLKRKKERELKKFKKRQQAIKRKNKNRKKDSSDLEKMINKSKHK